MELDDIKPLFWFGELDPLEHPDIWARLTLDTRGHGCTKLKIFTRNICLSPTLRRC
jgi:hypothetical protein